MIRVSEEEFEKLVEEAVAAIPPKFSKHLSNVAFMVADGPTREQWAAHQDLHDGKTMLLGLYEGIPLPGRSQGYSGVVPDVITVFRLAHERLADDLDELREDVHQTVWHEVAHYFGLDHGQIDAIEGED